MKDCERGRHRQDEPKKRHAALRKVDNSLSKISRQKGQAKDRERKIAGCEVDDTEESIRRRSLDFSFRL